MAIGFFLVVVLSCRSIRARATIAGLVVATVVVPALAEAREGRTIGFVWSGRYVLPVAVGVVLVLVAGFMATATGDTSIESFLRRSAVIVAAPVAASLPVTAYWLLRRFMVGFRGSLLLRNALWRPPVPAPLLLLVAVLATAGLAAVVIADVCDVCWPAWLATSRDQPS